MSELGIPGAPTCAHTAPTFGCRGCINKDRDSWAQKKFDEWAKTYKPGSCCGRPMKAYTWYFGTGGKLMASVICQVFEDSGMCDDLEVEIG